VLGTILRYYLLPLEKGDSEEKLKAFVQKMRRKAE